MLCSSRLDKAQEAETIWVQFNL